MSIPITHVESETEQTMSLNGKIGYMRNVLLFFGKLCTELLQIFMTNKTATVIENIVLFDVSAYA